ncbi:MAG: tetratricopeptide repeat protein [Chloroflexota bacterium]|nr:tetratricopeptide repeat protein [Chloroflexota bacterium]
MAYNLAAVRRMISDAFGSDELQDFCFDYFQEVYNDFADGQSKSDRVRMLIDYGLQHDLLEKLLVHVQEANPNKYAEFEPRLRVDPQATHPTYGTPDEETPAEVDAHSSKPGTYWQRRLQHYQAMAIDLFNQGMAAEEQGDFDAARGLYERVLSIHEKRKDQDSIADTLNSLGALNFKQAASLMSTLGSALQQQDIDGARQRLDQALELGERSEEIYRNLEDTDGLAASATVVTFCRGLRSMLQGISAFQQANSAEAHTLLAEARHHFEESKQSYLEIKEIFGAENASFIEGMPGMINQLQAQLDQVPPSAFAIYDLQRQAEAAYNQGNYDQAQHSYNESLETSRSSGNEEGIATSLYGLGKTAHQRQNLGEALSLYSQSLELSRRLGLQSVLASSLMQLGVIAQQQGNYGEARQFLKEALGIYEREGRPEAEAIRQRLTKLDEEG